MEIYYTDKARKNLKELPHPIQKRIAAKMRFYETQKNPIKFAKKLTNPDEGGFRFRIGDYRVVFDVEGSRIFVLKIAHRGKVYE